MGEYMVKFERVQEVPSMAVYAHCGRGPHVGPLLTRQPGFRTIWELRE